MCELLGMAFNMKVNSNISFRGFRHKGEQNPDGWGIAFYPDKSVQIIKEPIKAGKSKLSKFLQDYGEITSKIFIAHVRFSSIGEKRHENTHPFFRELNGKEYVFAHNGTLRNYKNLELGRFKPVGDTDSEYIFCHLLDCIEKENIADWKKENFDWLLKKFREINDYGDFNCMLSDGEYLFCFHDKNGYNEFHYIQRKPPYGNIKLKDEDYEINLEEEKHPEQTGYIIATKKLTDENWEELKSGQLIIFRNGKIVYFK